MRTAFSLRVDKERMLNDSLDVDYFETKQKQTKIEEFKAKVALFEHKF